MVKEVHGDIFNSVCNYKAIPVNLVSVMGKGLALAFKKKYPGFFDMYKDQIRTGKLAWRKPSFINDFVMFPTKNHWRDSSNPEDICYGLVELKRMLAKMHPGKYSIVSLALPALGCGCGGMDYGVLKKIVDFVFADEDKFIVNIYPPR